MSICIATDCVNEGFASEPVLGAKFCFTHWNEAKAAFARKNFTRKNKNPYGDFKYVPKIYFLMSDMYIKIGLSSDPLVRTRGIRGGSDIAEKPADLDFQKLECIGWFPGTLREEKRLHQKYAPYKAAGEYYNRTTKLELEIQKEINIGRRRRA